MSLLVFTQGDTQPSITETVTSDGVPVNLSSSTATFNMRPVGSTALKVSSSATVVSPKANGNLQYDWQPTDLDTAGTYLIWWDITTSGAVQTVSESLIEVVDHDPTGYVEVEEFKSSLGLVGQTYADLDIKDSINAATRAITNICGHRSFFKDVGTSVRLYDAPAYDMVLIEDAVTVAEFAIDLSGTGSNFVAQPTNSWVAGPYNNPVQSRPYEWIRMRNYTSPYLPTWYQQTIRVTAQHGWPEVPPPIKEATTMLAHRLVRRKREAPFGIMTLSMESQRAIRIAQSDPDVGGLLEDYTLTRPF